MLGKILVEDKKLFLNHFNQVVAEIGLNGYEGFKHMAIHVMTSEYDLAIHQLPG